MSELTQEKIEELRRAYKEADFNCHAIAGADNHNVILCTGYHEETDEYEFDKFAEVADEDTAQYVAKALFFFQDSLDEINHLRAELSAEKEKHRSRKCSDEKPEYGQQVLLNYGEPYVRVQGYWNGERWVETGAGYKEPYIQPISWQPLPEGDL